jgi:hypothetical protein
VAHELNSAESRYKGGFEMNEQFEEILDANVLRHSSRYESLAETLIKDSMVIWESEGTIAKVELVDGRLLGSLKPSTYSNFTEPLTSTPFSLSGTADKSEITDLIAWLETEIAIRY